jgi:hypothetical protein
MSKRHLTWHDVLGFLAALLVVTILSEQAKATEPRTDQSQNQSQITNAGGGQGGGASNQFSERTTAIGVSATAPEPLHATPECFLPPKGIRRVRQALWGIVSLDSRLVPDQACMDALKATREFELAKLDAERQLEQARAQRIRAETSRSCAEQADRALEACVVK